MESLERERENATGFMKIFDGPASAVLLYLRKKNCERVTPQKINKGRQNHIVIISLLYVEKPHSIST
jgi:hypothetical protein